MHDMQTIVTDDRGVCSSVCHAAQIGGACHVLQPLPNNSGFLLLCGIITNCSDVLYCKA